MLSAPLRDAGLPIVRLGGCGPLASPGLWLSPQHKIGVGRRVVSHSFPHPSIPDLVALVSPASVSRGGGEM